MQNLNRIRMLQNSLKLNSSDAEFLFVLHNFLSALVIFCEGEVLPMKDQVRDITVLLDSWLPARWAGGSQSQTLTLFQAKAAQIHEEVVTGFQC